MFATTETLVFRSMIAISVLAVAGANLNAQNAVEKILVGGTTVTALNSYTGSTQLAKPTHALVYDFDVPTEVITLDHSPAAHILGHGPIAHLKGDAGQNDSSAKVAAKVQVAFSKAMVKALSKESIPTTSAAFRAEAGEPAAGTLVVRGDFTDVNLGNETKRVLVGFGRGASDVKAHVTVSLITANGSILLSEFELTSKSGKKPGAAATMVVAPVAIGAAASVAGTGKATVESDASRMAKAVAKQIENIITARHWDPSNAQTEPAHRS
jgi:hypothetical protein